MAESEGGRSAAEQDGSAQAPPRTSSSLSDDVESPMQVVPANVGDSTLSPEQFARYFKEMARRFGEDSPNPSISFVPFTPGAREQGGHKKPIPEGPVSDPEARKVYLRTLLASSGLGIDDLREVVKEISPTTVAAPPAPRDPPKMPPPPPHQAVESAKNFGENHRARRSRWFSPEIVCTFYLRENGRIWARNSRYREE